MKNILKDNWKIITLSVLGVIFIYLLIRVFTPIPDRSELNKYKLDQINKNIEGMKKLLRKLDFINELVTFGTSSSLV